MSVKTKQCYLCGKPCHNKLCKTCFTENKRGAISRRHRYQKKLKQKDKKWLTKTSRKEEKPA